MTTEKKSITSYQVFVIIILTLTQFSIVLDFMVLSPLGAILMPALELSTKQFATVVSSYAFSAAVSAIAAAGFADRFDRKKLLLFFYIGFTIGTLGCALAPTYNVLLIARIVTGLFGGVIGSICFAIITDLFELQFRGRVMGFVQMAFSGSQVLGIPLSLYLATKYDWHSPFFLIVAVSFVMTIAIAVFMNPVNAHLAEKNQRNAFAHLYKTLTNSTYLKGFAATTLLATGGFMLMPFGSVFSVNNLGVAQEDLTFLYLMIGLFSLVTSPLIGLLADKAGKYETFVAGSLLSMVMVYIYCNLGITPLWSIIAISAIMFMGVSSRMVSSQALMSAVPAPQDRGAFMSLNSSVQQISGGIATTVAGLIVYRQPSGKLENYDVLGLVVIGATLITIFMFYFIHRIVKEKASKEVKVTTQQPGQA